MRPALESIRRGVAFYWRLALRNVVRQGARTLLTLSAIVLGVSGLIVTGGFVRDIFVQLGEGTIHSQLGHIQIYRRGYIQHGIQHPLAYLIADPEHVTLDAKRLPEVRETMSRLNFSGVLSNGQNDFAVAIEGVEPAKEALVATYHSILAGRRLRRSDAYGIYVGEGVAKRLHLRPRQPVTLVTRTIGGALNTLDLEVVGVFRSYSKDYDARTVQINLPVAHELLQTRGVNSIVVLLAQTPSTDAVAAHLRTLLGPEGFDVQTWKQLSDFYTKTVALFQRQFGFLEMVILLLIVLSVLNTINLNLYERRGEFGTMRALGNSNRRVFALIMSEGLVLGIVGGLAGAVVGILLALAISAVGIPMPPPPNSELGYVAQIRLAPWGVISAAMIGAVASIVAATLPGLRISRTPIADALRANV